MSNDPRLQQIPNTPAATSSTGPTPASTTKSATPNTTPTAAPSGNNASKIGGRESGGNYDTIFGKAGGATINGKLVTENTIGEVAAWQADEKSRKTNKQAAGKYQFMDVNAAAKQAGLGPNDLFNAENQDKMMAAYTAENAKQLRAYGLPDTEEYLSMAHADGAKGTKKLIYAQNAGMGDANSLDVLGLQGAAAKTNPQLNTNVDTTIAALKGGGPMGHGGSGAMLAKNKSDNPTAVVSKTPEKIKEDSGEPKMSPMEQVFNSMLASSGIDITKISPDVKESAGKINQATTQVAETKESKSESQSPIVNNVTNNINNSKSSGGGSSASTASVYDDLFAKLVERALA
jgi:hypothetical protein